MGDVITQESGSATALRTFSHAGPISGAPISTVPAHGVDEANAAVERAAAAFPAWSAMAPTARRAVLLRAADVLEAASARFVDLVAAETGSTGAWGAFNVRLAAGNLREAAAMCTQIKGEVLPSDKPGCVSLVLRKPAGVCVAIAPWNAPLILAARAIALPLACGNTVVLKGSEFSPATHQLLGEVMQEAGLPAGVLTVLSVDGPDNPAVVEALIAHPAVRRINFTGSTRVGRVVGALAGHHLKPVVLELGGKAAFIVLDDADLDEAVAAAAFGAYMHQGQICMSTERLILHEAIADTFLEKLAAKVATLTSGPPSGGSPLSAMIDARAARTVRELIDDAVSKGAHLVAGEQGEGLFLPATLLDRVTPDMTIYHEESFGPVAIAVRVSSAEEAVTIANESEYGLSSAIFTQDVTRALAMAKRLDIGAVHINGPTVQDEAHVPFGGIKASGFGRFGGQAGVHEFTDLCWVTIEEGGAHYPI